MKLDLRTILKPFYTASAKRTVVMEIPKLKYLMIDGAGAPGSPEFQQSIDALYGLTYTVKFTVKFEKPARDFTVMPLEGLWWCQNDEFKMDAPQDWLWTLMIVQPEFVTATMIRAAGDKLRDRRGEMPAVSRVRLESWQEGRVVQRLHVGPYNSEQPTIDAMREFASENGLTLSGKHHEIYMSDPRRTAPVKLKTILRHPVAAARRSRAVAA